MDTPEFAVDETKPYAELWLGTHPNGMSRVTNCSNDVVSLAEHTEGGAHCGGQCNELTFLLKVLSVRKVLSIQAHPDKALAERLHTERPTVYKDPNHKPEMAICLSDEMRALYGFRSLADIVEHCAVYPELRTLLGEAMVQELKETSDEKQTLRKLFEAYLNVDATVMEFLVERMVTRLQHATNATALDKLILQLQEQFPGDCGIFAPLLMNVVTIPHGQALYIGANEPHAYIQGEILECMACSDNVVRAGLTPKLKDVPTLVNMLTYETGVPTLQEGDKVDACTRRYLPPISDFLMEVIDVPAGDTYTIEGVDSPTVLLTLDGDAALSVQEHALNVSVGLAVFGSAHASIQVQAGPYGVRLARACRNVYHEE